MTPHTSLDIESFQKFLSNAFEVQESGIDSESLAAIADLQRSIAAGELDVDDAMDFVAASARNVANAAGIAIGLLKDDQLVYRAGSGSAAVYVGLRVMATLCAAAHDAANSEILRVEDAQADVRIEAAICRQFGAQALLILPIYRGRAVAGVFEVLFNEAHAFQPREVRSYRLMIALIEEALSFAARPAPQRTLTADPPAAGPSTGLIARPLHATHQSIPAPHSATSHALCPACGKSITEDSLPAAHNQLIHAALKQAQQVPRYAYRWEAAAAAVLVIAFIVAYRDLSLPSTQGASIPQRSNATAQPVSIEPAQPVLVNSSFKPQDSSRLPDEARRAASLPKQRGASHQNSRFSSDDVAVRRFTSNAASRKVPDTNVEVRHISDDVTVRYFSPKPKPRIKHKNDQVRYISDDVTVRYFSPHPEDAKETAPVR